jgi:hypothetical protein
MKIALLRTQRLYAREITVHGHGYERCRLASEETGGGTLGAGQTICASKQSYYGRPGAADEGRFRACLTRLQERLSDRWAELYG